MKHFVEWGCKTVDTATPLNSLEFSCRNLWTANRPTPSRIYVIVIVDGFRSFIRQSADPLIR
jgi:hypothetical protein